MFGKNFLIFLFVFGFNKCNAVENVQLLFEQDPSYPNTMNILALQYELISDKVVVITVQFQIHEELTQGTKVNLIEFYSI